MANTKQDQINEYLTKTYDTNPSIRSKVVRELCPCKVQKDIDEFWSRLFEMVTDPDATVRYNVVHTLCDGSPKEKESDIINALEKLWNDPDENIRRNVRKALGEYRRTGNWNVL